MEQSPSWKAYGSLDSQEIPRILSYPHVYYQAHKIPLVFLMYNTYNFVFINFKYAKVHDSSWMIPNMYLGAACIYNMYIS